jgi:hypothetical protein
VEREICPDNIYDPYRLFSIFISSAIAKHTVIGRGTKSALGGYMDLSAFQHIPATIPPPGVTPDFENPESRGSVHIITGAVLLALMMLFYAIRIYAKVFVIKRFHWDDCKCGGPYPTTNLARRLICMIDPK